MILKKSYFFRGDGSVVMLKKSPYILELYTKVIVNEILWCLISASEKLQCVGGSQEDIVDETRLAMS